MSKGIKGERIQKIKRDSDAQIRVLLKNGDAIIFKAIGFDFGDAELKAEYIKAGGGVF